MTDDIVARLRVWSRWLDERVPDSAVGDDLRAAADEIERLRGDRETMLSLLGTIADIRDAAGVGDRVMLGELAERIKHLRDERDGARAEVCRLRSSVCLGAPSRTTVGWSCFKEATDGSR